MLVVCTANVCRSPVAERLLRRAIGGRVDAHGDEWVVTSAGTAAGSAPLDRHTITAAAEAGIGLSDHVPRRADPDVVATDGADLVVTMAREHVRAIAVADPAAWPRTFTLKELVRRAGAAGAWRPGESWADWLRRIGEGRRTVELLGSDPGDDVADPYGLPARHHAAMVAEVAAAVDDLVRLGPWPRNPPGR